MVSAPASGQGKTTLTAGIACLHKSRGKNVRVFKVGPDFLDPMILERASGNPVYQLDLWMNGENNCRQLLHEASGQADLILIEGVMGLYDGKPSSADLAVLFDIPVLLIIDAGSMAQTFAAVAQGITNFRPSLRIAGVVANNVASARHAAMLKEDFPPSIPYLGEFFRSDKITLPSRHLGLVQAEEIADIDERLRDAAQAVELTQIDRVIEAVDLPPVATDKPPDLLKGLAIAVAKDAAFSFLYEANLQLLCEMGARLEYFSPIADKCLPDVDSVYLPGGYPELYLKELESNVGMKESLSRHFASEKPIYAECGGMLYLLDSLEDKQGKIGRMVGLLPGSAVMESRLKGLGYQSAEFERGVLRGHTFHHSKTTVDATPASYGTRLFDSSAGEPIYQLKGLITSYLHLYFPSNPIAAASLFKRNIEARTHKE